MKQTILENQAKTGKDDKGRPTISLWLENRCRNDKLSLRKAAAKIGISHNTVASIINGERPSAETIMKLAVAFSENGQYQRTALEDFLLSLCGYRSVQKEVEITEPLGRLMDKVSHFNETQLQIVEQFADFIAKVGDGLCPKRSL